MERIDGERVGTSSALIKNGVVTVRRVHTHPPPKSLKTYLASKDMKILARNELHLSPSQIMNRAFADTLENQLFPNVPVSKMYSESTDEPEALDDWEELEAILVALQDPPELQMTAESASGNRVTAPRQHPFLLRKSEKGGCYHLEKVAMVVGIVKLPANTTTKPMKNS
ncbi:hypothetical protein PV325_006567 [Microctonus aethiopoides]|nr:hypothetical protein PV325_006567 [Microctonus aethiopoides]